MSTGGFSLEDAVQLLKQEGYTVSAPVDAPSEPCFYCGSPSFRLCDGVLGWLKRIVYEPLAREVIDTRDPIKSAFTCDRPLCKDCIKETTPKFFCGKRPHFDTEDICAECVHSRDNPPESALFVIKGHAFYRHPPLVTQEEGAAMQRRRLMKITPHPGALT